MNNQRGVGLPPDIPLSVYVTYVSYGSYVIYASYKSYMSYIISNT